MSIFPKCNFWRKIFPQNTSISTNDTHIQIKINHKEFKQNPDTQIESCVSEESNDYHRDLNYKLQHLICKLKRDNTLQHETYCTLYDLYVKLEKENIYLHEEKDSLQHLIIKLTNDKDRLHHNIYQLKREIDYLYEKIDSLTQLLPHTMKVDIN